MRPIDLPLVLLHGPHAGTDWEPALESLLQGSANTERITSSTVVAVGRDSRKVEFTHSVFRGAICVDAGSAAAKASSRDVAEAIPAFVAELSSARDVRGEGHRRDIVLLDIHLLHRAGQLALRRVVERAAASGATRIIATTARLGCLDAALRSRFLCVCVPGSKRHDNEKSDGEPARLDVAATRFVSRISRCASASEAASLKLPVSSSAEDAQPTIAPLVTRLIRAVALECAPTPTKPKRNRNAKQRETDCRRAAEMSDLVQRLASLEATHAWATRLLLGPLERDLEDEDASISGATAAAAAGRVACLSAITLPACAAALHAHFDPSRA